MLDDYALIGSIVVNQWLNLNVYEIVVTTTIYYIMSNLLLNA